MRGRINSDLYSGIAINATTDQFEVSGGNIMAGDFVQYKYAAAEQKTLFNSTRLDWDLVLFKLSQFLFLDRKGNLYEFINDNLSVVNSLSFIPAFFDKISNTKFCCTNGSDGYIVTVDHQSKTFNIAATISLLTSDSFLLYIGNDKVINFYQNIRYNEYNDRLLIFTYKVYDISDLQNITEYDNGEYEITSWGSNYGSSHYYFAHYNNKIAVYNRLSASGSSNTYLYVLDYDITNKSISKTTHRPNMTVTSQNMRCENNINQIYYYSDTVYSVNLENGNITNFPAGTTTDWADGVPVRMSEIDENGEFYISSDYHWVSNRIYYDRVTIAKCRFLSNGSFETVYSKASKQETRPADNRWRVVFSPINCGSKTALLYKYYSDNDGTGTYYYNANVIGSQLVIGEQDDVVEPYDGTNPKMLMGVAATSGQVGDTIDVYKPMVIT